MPKTSGHKNVGSKRIKKKIKQKPAPKACIPTLISNKIDFRKKEEKGFLKR